MKYILIIGSGVRETAIAKRLLSDSTAKINLIAISDKFNPQMIDYCEKESLLIDKLRSESINGITKKYNWDFVTNQYLKVLKPLVSSRN